MFGKRENELQPFRAVDRKSGSYFLHACRAPGIGCSCFESNY